MKWNMIEVKNKRIFFKRMLSLLCFMVLFEIIFMVMMII